jgi:hypothetical protein
MDYKSILEFVYTAKKLISDAQLRHNINYYQLTGMDDVMTPFQARSIEALQKDLVLAYRESARNFKAGIIPQFPEVPKELAKKTRKRASSPSSRG